MTLLILSPGLRLLAQEDPRALSSRDSVKEFVNVDKIPIFIKAKQTSSERYRFAVSKGAEFFPTPDGRSFYLQWFPPHTNQQNLPPVIFSLHGHGSWAFDEFFLWQSVLSKEGFGIIALQWWFGEGEKINDYDLPLAINQNMARIFYKLNLPERSVLAHGFSRGSANIYGLTALDNRKDKYLLMTIANAGKPGTDFPINRDIQNGRFGVNPLRNTYWVTCAGARDTHPDRDGIEGMREAQEWIRRLGGTVLLAIEDPMGDHGCFHRNPKNMENAVDVFKKLWMNQKNSCSQ